MGILSAILFGKTMGKKVNLKRTGRVIRKDSMFLVELITEVFQVIYIVVRFIFRGFNTMYRKCFCQKTVEVEKINVINLNEYKSKKAKQITKEKCI